MNQPAPRVNESQNRQNQLILLFFAVVVLVIYVLTVPRTNTWWFGSSYKMAAVTFGIHFPPGSLLLTMLGWLVVQLPFGISEAFALNLLASVLGVFACGMIMVLAMQLIRRNPITSATSSNKTTAVVATEAVGLSVLGFAFAYTTWRWSIEFMPYVLTAAFTTLILWAIMKWWAQSDHSTSEIAGAGRDRWLFLLMLLFGLDLSVHRTNLLLLPAFLLWVLMCKPGAFARLKAWFAGGIGLIVGLAFQLLTMPIAAREPIVNASDPSNWERFYYYVSLQQYGGGWLVNMWPRKAPFWDVQIGDYLRVFADNFVSYGGVLALVPLLFAAVGLVALWRQDLRLAIGLVILFAFSSLGVVIYFNLPEGFFQPMDRHYLPSLVIFALIVAYGAGFALLRVLQMPGKLRIIAIGLGLVLVVAMPVKQLARNYHLVDGSNDNFARDYAHNILSTVQPDAILFVAGDNYHTVSYLQIVENMRPDVITLSPSLCNTEWYVRQAMSQHPGIPLALTEEELSGIGPVEWAETIIPTRVSGTSDSFQLPEGEAPPDKFDLVVPPTVADRFIFAQDWLLVKMIEEDQWRRPIYFTHPPAWLSTHTRLEGLVHRLIPQDSVALNTELLRENLFDRYRYRGYADSRTPIGRYSQLMGHQLVQAFCTLARYELDRGDPGACEVTAKKLSEVIPLDRVDPSTELQQTVDELCNSEK
jgi:hypothetical protein